MGDINYISTVVRLLEEPRKLASENFCSISEARAQLAQVRKNDTQNLITLSFWGNLSETVQSYYKPNDYLIIEGYVLVKTKPTKSLSFQAIKITVLKVYPILLTSN